jgi:choline transport protein
MLTRLTNLYSWPLATPVTAATMNWSSVLFFSCILISIIFWFAKGRHVYTGPVAQMRRDL